MLVFVLRSYTCLQHRLYPAWHTRKLANPAAASKSLRFCGLFSLLEALPEIPSWTMTLLSRRSLFLATSESEFQES